MDTTTEHSTEQKIYQPPLLWRTSPFLICLGVVAFVWIVFLLAGSGSSAKASGRADLFTFLLILSPGMLILGALWCLTTLNTRIVTTPEGITYCNAGLCLYSPWQNIIKCEQVVMGARSIDNLRLRLTALDGMSLEEGMKEHIAVITKAPALRTLETTLPFLKAFVLLLSVIAIFSGGRYKSAGVSSSGKSDPQRIPVGLFGQHWRDGELRQDIRRYAPQAGVGVISR